MSLNVVINREWKDQAENDLLMDLALDNYTVTLGAIYGPNNTGREFFRFLNQALAESEGQYKVIGGDWNTVLDPLPIPQNVDFINMVGIPNPVNGTLLREMCVANSLSDPTARSTLIKKTIRTLPLVIYAKTIVGSTSSSSQIILYHL
jgi:hypothetical protein